MLVLIFAHPYPDRSRANQVLLEAVHDMPGLSIRSLYDLYPNFGIDVETEQAALSAADHVIWQHPMYWYSAPGLLKHWFDKVLARGWAYGEQGNALRGKRCLWVTTTGGNQQAFSERGMHGHTFETFSPVIEQTARFCGMQWESPIILHGAHQASKADLLRAAADYRARLEQLLRMPPGNS